MTFALKSSRAVRGRVLWLAIAVSACAQGVAERQPFQGALDNGSASESDASANGADNAGDNARDASQPDGANGQDNTGGNVAASDGSANAGGDVDAGGTSASMDAGPNPSPPDAGPGQDAATSQCLPGTSPCGALCVDFLSSAAHCGRCGHVCAGGQACNGAGACFAPAGCTAKSFGVHDYFVCTNGKSWMDSRSACKTWGLDLAVIETKQENAFLMQFGPAWMAYNDLGREDTWRWAIPGAGSDGATLSYTNWDPNEPNGQTSCGLFCTRDDEDCGELKANGTWNDAKCGNAMTFLCETY